MLEKVEEDKNLRSHKAKHRLRCSIAAISIKEAKTEHEKNQKSILVINKDNKEIKRAFHFQISIIFSS